MPNTKKRIQLSHIFKDGLLMLMPLTLTLALIYWGWSLVRGFIPNLSMFFPKSLITNPSFTQLLDFIYLLIVLAIITIFGMIASTFLGKFFMIIVDKILMKPSFIQPIYVTFQKLTKSIFQQNNDPLLKGISESILVPYPNKDCKSIGFITSNHAKHLLGEEEGDKWLTVYLPSAPLVSAGFYLICRKEDTEPCRLSSSQAMTSIISVGSINPSRTEEPEHAIPNSETSRPNLLRVWFINGILILTPILATVYILSWIFNYLYSFSNKISSLLPTILPTNIPYPYYDWLINLIILIILSIIIFSFGLLGESAFGLWIKNFSNRLFNTIPMFNKIYQIVEQITQMFSSDPSKTGTFEQAVLVPYPTSASYAIGFITNRDSSNIKVIDGNNFSSVFIPTTPIPTTGWFSMVPIDQIIHLDMTPEKAFALVISGGILTEDKE